MLLKNFAVCEIKIIFATCSNWNGCQIYENSWRWSITLISTDMKHQDKTKKIVTSMELRKRLQAAFNVTDRAVRNALDWSSNSHLAEKIRFTALKEGGVMVGPLNNIETFHDADGIMRQYLPNGAVIEFSRADNTGRILLNGGEVATYTDITIPKIYEIQSIAATL